MALHIVLFLPAKPFMTEPGKQSSLEMVLSQYVYSYWEKDEKRKVTVNTHT
uniref:Uncharacterized protein n=1 Tax=Thermosporothrix sp. COM3 TaxID=2490863 RepID=A0A455SJI7_9CHLR|nr:hypothetical protein KTC_33740 [Thermosporothrix sp. COM3]